MGAIIWTNCSKTKDDNLPTTESSNVAQARSENFALTTNEVSLENGTLVFRNQQVFDNVAASLNALDQDEAFKSNFIASRGASALDDESPNFVINPAAQAFEERFSGYVSLRKKIYANEANATEGNPAPKQDIQSPILQTLVNEHKEVKIGDLIYKDIDEHHTFVVLDGNLGVLNELRSLSNPFSTNLPEGVIVLDDRLERDQAIGRGLSSPLCNTIITVDQTIVNSFKIPAKTKSNSEDVDAATLTYTWLIKDANGNTIYNLSKKGANKINPTLPLNTVYPVTVSLYVTGGICGGHAAVPIDIASAGQPDCDFTFTFVESPITVNLFYCYISSQSGANPVSSTYTWTFTNIDGTTKTLVGNNVEFTPKIVNGASNFTISVNGSNSIGCNITKTASVVLSPCGTHPKDATATTNHTSSRRSKCVLWVDNKWFYNGFGSKQLFERFKPTIFGGKWVSEKADVISFVFMPTDRFIKGCYIFTDLPDAPYSLPSAAEVRCEYQENGYFFTVRPTEVTCTFSVTEDGVSFPNHTTLGF